MSRFGTVRLVFLLCLCSAAFSHHLLHAPGIIDSYMRTNDLIRTRMAATDNSVERVSAQQFRKTRDDFIQKEINRGLGATLTLSGKEELLNTYLMKAKDQELAKGLENCTDFLPARHLFEVLPEIEKSTVFQILRKMPKAGVLHAHDTSICSLDYVVGLTYWPHLWQCDSASGFPQFKFSRTEPQTGADQQWRLVKEVREQVGSQTYDAKLRKMMSLYSNNPITENRDIDSIWNRFMQIFGILDGIVTYKPVWEDYYRQALEEFYEDGVQYLELRSLLPPLYDLEGNVYDEVAVVQIYYDVLHKFKQEHPNFIGGKVIYAPLRAANDSQFQIYLDTCTELHEKFPDFMIGFDLVGQEDKGRPLIDFAEKILTLPPTIKFYFHAGETNWNGITDDNLVDAILLGTQRIGHGFALIKHPAVMEYIKLNGIAVEVNPISNQVLRLITDYRNHPAAVFFTDDYPVVVSCDDPSFWETKPLSHDFYQAFVGIANSRQDLRFLKQLAINSIMYSAMTCNEKNVAMTKWTRAWDEFVSEMVSQLPVPA